MVDDRAWGVTGDGGRARRGLRELLPYHQAKGIAVAPLDVAKGSPGIIYGEGEFCPWWFYLLGAIGLIPILGYTAFNSGVGFGLSFAWAPP